MPEMILETNLYGTGEKPGPTINGCCRAGTVDVEKDVGRAEKGAEAIDAGTVDTLDGKITDDTAGAVNVFTKEGTKIGLHALGVCTAVGSCGALEGANSEVAAAKGRLDQSMCGVAGRDDTKD